MEAVAGAGAVARSASRAQFGLINLLKAGAAQLIVLHHLAFYGPMADHVRPLLPGLIDWLSGTARIAVQVFLVIGGFLAAKSLSPAAAPGFIDPLPAIWRRYVKLAPPFLAATLIAAVASALASEWMLHDSISPPPTLRQLGAHGLLLHGVLGYSSISAGAWYVAIDFQLYALVVSALWLAGWVAGPRLRHWLMPVLTTLGVAFSLLYFNLDADWDNWAIYFFGSYGLGLMAWWAGDPARKPATVFLLLVMMLLPALAALMIEFRSRIALALAVACALFLFGRVKATSPGRAWATVHWLARISYSVFLIHFPVCLLVNAGFTRFAPAEPLWQGLGMLTAWAVSLLAGDLFFRWVETPLADLRLASLAHTITGRRASPSTVR